MMVGSSSRKVIRAATREDIPAIVRVTLSSVDNEELEGFGGVDTDSPFRDVAKLSAVWVDPNRVGTQEMFVAEIDGVVVGVVAVEDNESELELVDIDVARPYQGEGIGIRMVKFIEETARSRGRFAVTLGTCRNAAGIAWKSLPWWLALGYRITHEEENQWTRSLGAGFREIRMRKEISCCCMSRAKD